MSGQKKLKGYSHTYSDEKIKDYTALPIEMKLAWLEEAAAFTFEATPLKTKKIAELFRSGKI